MILIDSLYINNGGGKILLDYLVEKLEEKNESVFYLFDERCSNSFLNIPSERKVYLPASLLKRHQFYKNNIDRFKVVLCFGNLAPTMKLKMPVYTYFHQPMYLNIPKEFKLKEKFFFQIKTLLFELLLQNTSKLIVQHELMKNETVKKFKFTDQNILCLPFYPNEHLSTESQIREENTFIYVSSASPHKNHIKLIAAFVKFYDIYKKGKLILTVSNNYIDLCAMILDLKQKGYPIFNIGFVGRKELIENYYKSEYLIFPSLEESFGLGIVEAIECGCKVIGADLPYTYQVCIPSISFNPQSIDSIFNAFENSIKKNERNTIKLINNEIEKLLKLLTQ